MYRQVQRLVRRREGEFVHVRPSAKDRGDFRWKKTQDEAPGRNALKKGNNGCRQAELCIVIETSRPASLEGEEVGLYYGRPNPGGSNCPTLNSLSALPLHHRAASTQLSSRFPRFQLITFETWSKWTF